MTLNIPVTLDHLERAIKATQVWGDHDQHCLVAQAVKDAGIPFSSVGRQTIYDQDADSVYGGGHAMGVLTSAFDTRQYDKLRAMLPLTLTLTRVR